jgi:glutathione reductase (NADPH)
MERFDVIVIGTGTSGQTAALELAAEGLSVAVIEASDTPGGVCALRGCQPKKYFYEVAEVMAKSMHLHGLGIMRQPAANWADIAAAKNKFTAQIPDHTVANLKGSGITYISGKAVFKDSSHITVGESVLRADYIVIGSGAEPMQLPFDGSEHLLTSADFLALDHLPQRLAFVGGGFISFEFAHFAARINDTPREITILEVSEQPLGPFDKDMVDQLVQASTADAITIRCEVDITAVEKSGDEFIIHFKNDAPLSADLVINGAGRAPAIDDLNLEAAGVSHSRKGIDVDQALRSSVETIFAVGDCADSIQLARIADREGFIAARNILAARGEGEEEKISYAEVPTVLFTYPQLAMIGKTEEQLIEEKVRYWKSMETELSWPTYRRVGLRRAAFKILVDERDLLLGAHILSDNATGIINTFRLAMLHRIDIRQLRQDAVMSPYPSRESDMIYMLDPLVE